MSNVLGLEDEGLYHIRVVDIGLPNEIDNTISIKFNILDCSDSYYTIEIDIPYKEGGLID